MFNREKLSDIIPMDTPLVIFIEPARSCNMKCRYCYHSFSRQKAKELNIVNEGIMKFGLFMKVVEDLKIFPKKIKCVHMTSRGEPLLNKDLPEMISYLKKQDVTERINIVTNGTLLSAGTLLSQGMNIKLINSGLDSMKVSIQSVAQDGIDELIANIRHFYNHRGDCKLFVKIGDINLSEKEASRFLDTFSGICDEASIEHIYDIDTDLSLNLNIPISKVKVCPMPFYMLNIGFDGNVIPCCYYQMESFGNLKNMSIIEILNGDKLKEFRRSLLVGKKNLYCEKCNIPEYNIHPEDNIDGCTKQILERI